MKPMTKTIALAGFTAVTLAAGAELHSWIDPVAHANSSATAELTQATPQQPLETDPNIFSNLARKVIPSVVNISTVTFEKPSQGANSFMGPEQFFEEFFGNNGWGTQAWRGGNRWQARPQNTQPVPRSAALGTGFIIDPSGIILTNQHVVAGADEIKITFTESPDEKPTPGKVIGRDPELDVALIKVSTDRKLTALPLGDSDALQVGQYVAAVGNPFGEGHSFTHGIISAKGRVAPNVPLATYLQTDAPINPGNSGGPLIDLKGEVVGINNAIDARAQGIGFAIPINAVKGELQTLESKGTIARGYIGVEVSELNPEIAEKINVDKELRAPLVMQVVPGGPAFKAGIRPYDVITEFDGKPVRSPEDLTSAVTALPVGKAVKVKLSRADRTIETTIRLGKRPFIQQES